MDLICPKGHNQVRKVSGVYKEQGRLSPPDEPQHERLVRGNILNMSMLRFLGQLVGYPMAWAFFFLTMILACGTLGVGAALGAGTGVFLFALGSLLIVGGSFGKRGLKRQYIVLPLKRSIRVGKERIKDGISYTIARCAIQCLCLIAKAHP